MFKRALLKISGEALSGEGKKGFSRDEIHYLLNEIRSVVDDVKLGIVIGAGNLFRGEELRELDRIHADEIGMMGTVINSIYLKDAMGRFGMKAVVFSNFVNLPTVEPLNYRDLEDYFSKGYVVIFSGGTGNPLFTTDTAAALRAIEMKAEVLLKATKVDGIYDKDPKEFDDARFIDRITHDEVIKMNLHVMDVEAFSICRRFKLPILVFNIFKEGNLRRIMDGEKVGSLVLPTLE